MKNDPLKKAGGDDVTLDGILLHELELEKIKRY